MVESQNNLHSQTREDRPLNPSSLAVRPYLPSDRVAASQLLGLSDPWKDLGYSAEDWERVFASLMSTREGFVIASGDDVAGLALLGRRFLFGDCLDLLAIAPWARSQKLGSTLLAYVERLVFTRVPHLYLRVSDFNDRAQRFYTRRGYEALGPMPSLHLPGTHEILMRKSRLRLGENDRNEEAT